MVARERRPRIDRHRNEVMREQLFTGRGLLLCTSDARVRGYARASSGIPRHRAVAVIRNSSCVKGSWLEVETRALWSSYSCQDRQPVKANPQMCRH